MSSEIIRAYRNKQEFRCTIPHYYRGNCPGATNVSDRQGHYVDAFSAPEAAEIVRKDNKLAESAVIDVQAWHVEDEKQGTLLGSF